MVTPIILASLAFSVQLLALIIAYDLWRVHRRQHALVSIYAFVLLSVQRLFVILIQLDVVEPDSTPGHVTLLVIPLLISFLFYRSVTISKTKTTGAVTHE